MDLFGDVFRLYERLYFLYVFKFYLNGCEQRIFIN